MRAVHLWRLSLLQSFFALDIVNISYLQECINFDVRIGNRTYKFICLYRSPSQTKGEFEDFIKILVLNLEHIVNNSLFLIVVLGDFNVRSQAWYNDDILTIEGSKIDIITSHFSLMQIIKKPTHILNSSTWPVLRLAST